MLSVGIIGLPNVGKSTLFRALTKKQVEISNRPFTTIKPNIAVVALPDPRLEELKKLSHWNEVVPAVIEFIDIAGLVKNAHQGEGLGNQFLSYIRNVDAIAHIVRLFEDENINHIHGKIDPFYDIEVVNAELTAAGIEKPTLIVFNCSEKQLNPHTKRGQISENDQINEISPRYGVGVNWLPTNITLPYLVLSAKLELTLSDMNEQERKEFMEELEIKESGLEKLIKESYKLLDLITFFTVKGENQLRAWELPRGTPIIEAAGKIHTDFKEKFIRAEAINWQKLVEAGSWQKAREKGLIHTAGRDYIVQDGDVVEIKI